MISTSRVSGNSLAQNTVIHWPLAMGNKVEVPSTGFITGVEICTDFPVDEISWIEIVVGGLVAELVCNQCAVATELRK